MGLRLTLTRHNVRDLPQIFELIEREEIDRACFYHLVYSGRGRGISDEDLTHEETRAAVDYICEQAAGFRRRGIEKDILTVDNHADGVYVYLKLLQEEPERAQEVTQGWRARLVRVRPARDVRWEIGRASCRERV